MINKKIKLSISNVSNIDMKESIMNPTDNRKTKLQPNDAISDQAGIVHTQFRQHPELVIELATEPCFNRTVQVHSFPFW